MRRIALLLVCFAVGAPAAAQSDLCARPSEICAAELPTSCVARLGAAAIAAEPPGSECQARLAAYRDCLASVSKQCGGPPRDRAAAQDADRAAQPKRWIRQFDGRIGAIAIANPTLYPFEVTLWHPDNRQVFGRWTAAPLSDAELLHNGEVFNIGNDWGLQFGDGPVRSVGEATAWRDGRWRASPSRFAE